MGFNIIDENGPPCPRCGRPLQVREHDRIGRFYYFRWFYCSNKACNTSTVNLKKFRRYTNGHDALEDFFNKSDAEAGRPPNDSLHQGGCPRC